MGTAQTARLLTYVRNLAAVPDHAQRSDKELLSHFASQSDEAAFAVLLRRHGPMVLRVCWRVLRNWHDAEDAFQATFLLLARKAPSRSWHDSIANWLYQSAYHLALKARAAAARRTAHEARAGRESRHDALADLSGRELQTVLDEELARLPEKYRAPLVLCYLEGATRDEAAQQLGCPLSTLGLRLEQGRSRLRGRLERRGLMFSAALSAALLAEQAPAATLTSRLLAGTTQAATLVAAGKAVGGAISESVAGLLRDGLKTLAVPKLKVVAALMVALSAFAIGAGVWVRHALAEDKTATPQAETAKPLVLESSASQSKRTQLASVEALRPDSSSSQDDAQGKEKLTVSGRVVDADGKAVKQAQVAVVTRPRRRLHSWEWTNFAFDMPDSGRSDGQGHFCLSAPPPSGKVLLPVTPPWPRDETALVVSAPGYGLAWRSLEGDFNPTNIPITLRREQIIHGRLIDLQGLPAAGVQVVVARVRSEKPTQDGEAIDFRMPPQGLPPWPKPVITDDQGGFAIHGVAAGHVVILEVRDDRFARQLVEVHAGGNADRSFSLTPARRLVGRVLYADTRQPVPNVRLSVWALQKGGYPLIGATDGRTDAQGCFRINTFAGSSVSVTAFAPADAPYLNPIRRLEWPKGAIQQELEIALPRGVLVRGTISEKDSGKPVAGATVEFDPYLSDNRDVQSGVTVWRTSGPDGRFQIAVPPGKGHLLMNGPVADYIPQVIGANELEVGKPGGTPSYWHAVQRLDLKAEDGTKDLQVTFRRGVTVKGYLVDADGKAVQNAQMLCGGRPAPLEKSIRPVPIRDGAFELHGCDPEVTYPVLFLTAPYKPGINWISVPSNRAVMMKLHLAPFFGNPQWLGAAVQVSARQAAGAPIRVLLTPCTSVALRFVNGAEQLQPLIKFDPSIDLVVAPGPDLNEAWDRSILAGESAALCDSWVRWNPVGIATDMQGRLTLMGLIPGATYRINNLDGTLASEFKAPAHQTEKLQETTVKIH
ncbi:MAG TPA: sigma-70 family RNA polymerase sigma factor [Gemmataceae bacterium]|nr:sigma-70 family RNA polymerase sigma factor [Gemmataceae bacterium]